MIRRRGRGGRGRGKGRMIRRRNRDMKNLEDAAHVTSIPAHLTNPIHTQFNTHTLGVINLTLLSAKEFRV